MNIEQFIHDFFSGQISVPFYFIIVLFQLYLLYPFVVQLAKKRWFVYATLVFSLLNQFSLMWWIHDIPLAFRFLFFFVWGIYMREQLLVTGTQRIFKPWIALIALFSVYYLVFPGDYYNMRPYYGLSVFMLLYFLFTSGWVHAKIETSLAWLGKLSLWIFLLHFPLMEWAFPYFFTYLHLPLGAGFMLVVVSLLSVVLSVAAAYVANELYSRVVGLIKRRSTI
jgi:peptidoglycan/LPS O-acetylase OafA/YrhL